MGLAFAKLEALGNDFMLVQGAQLTLTADQIRALADRRTGVGFDQLLFVCPRSEPAHYDYRIYNADGSTAAQCGNGARCVGRWLRETTAVGSDALIRLELAGHAQHVRVRGDVIAAELPPPQFAIAGQPRARQSLGTVAVRGAVLSLGNPHFVIDVDDTDRAEVSAIGAAINADPAFVDGVNVGFMSRLAAGRVALRVFERGVGETRACGSGAAAAAVVAMLDDQRASTMTVAMPGGELQVHWAGLGQPVWIEGPARLVYRGELA